MIELISNSAHNSEIYAYFVEEDNGKQSFRKVATTEFGFATLQREQAGWSWYAGRRYRMEPAPSSRYLSSPTCARWEMDWIKGQNGEIEKGLWPNRIALQEGIKHYINVWPEKRDSIPMHGDYSLVNFIFNSQGLHVLDWECFTEQGPPWGFDPLFLLFEALWFSRQKNRKIFQKEYSFIADSLMVLTEKGRDIDAYVSAPLKNVRDYVIQFPAISGQRLLKPPVLQFSDTEVLEIDDQIRHALKRRT